MADEFFRRDPAQVMGDIAKLFGNLPVDESVRMRTAMDDMLQGMGGGLHEGPIDELINRLRAGGGDPRQWSRADMIRHLMESVGEIGRRQDITANNMNDIINVGGQVLQDIADIRGLLGVEGRAARDEKQQERAPPANYDDGLGGLAGDLLGGMMDIVGIPADQRNIINGLIDRNGDGKVDGAEIKNLFDDKSAINSIANLSPAFARMLRDPNFRMRTIEKIDEPTIGGKNPRDKFEQVNLVQQGYANYDLAENMFNVNF